MRSLLQSLSYPRKVRSALSQLELPFPRKKKPFNLDRFIRTVKIVLVEILSAVVFVVWIFRAFLNEIKR